MVSIQQIVCVNFSTCMCTFLMLCVCCVWLCDWMMQCACGLTFAPSARRSRMSMRKTIGYPEKSTTWGYGCDPRSRPLHLNTLGTIHVECVQACGCVSSEQGTNNPWSWVATVPGASHHRHFTVGYYNAQCMGGDLCLISRSFQLIPWFSSHRMLVLSEPQLYRLRS